MQLHNYQKNIIRFLLTRKNAILSVDMGLGKTIATLEWLQILSPDTALIVAPKRVAENNWMQEAEKWGLKIAERMTIVKGTPKKRAQALQDAAHPYKIISRDNLKDVQPGTRYDVLILDELTSFKTDGSSRSKYVQRIPAKYKVGLTGTFLANGAIDIYAQAKAVGLDFNGRNFYEWRANHFRNILQGSGLAFQKWIPSKPLATILQPIADNIYTLTADEWLEIPEKTETIHKVDVGEETRKAIADLDSFLSAEIGGETVVFHEGQKFAKLQTLCDGFVYLDDGNVVRGAEGKKMTIVADFVDDCHNAGEPVLLFYAFREEAKWLRELLEARGLRVALPTDAGFLEKWNAGEVDCLMAHPASAGHGLNLQHGGRVIVWSTMTYNYEYFAQANARLARQGQRRNVQIHYFIAENTVEERVVAALQKKDNEQKQFLKLTK